MTHNPVILNIMSLAAIQYAIHDAVKSGDIFEAIVLNSEYNALLRTIHYTATLN